MTSSILVTDASQKNSLGIIRSLGREGFNVYVLASSKLDQSIYSRYCRGYIVLEKLDVGIVKKFILDNNIEFVLPVGVTSVNFFSDNREIFAKISKFLLPSEEQIKICISKEMTLKAAAEIDIPCPKTIFPKSISDAEMVVDEIGFPCVIKWIYEVGENIVEYALDKEDLQYKYQEICDKHSFDEETGYPMLQEFIDGKGVGYFALFHEGTMINSYQHERIREAPPSGGVSVCAKTIFDEDLEKFGEKFLSHLGWNGVAMVEFKMLNDGSFKLMEINPKFWGSHDLGIESGVNFPLSIVKILSKEDFDSDSLSSSKKMIKFHWPLEGDIKYMFDSPQRFLSVVKDFLNPHVKSNLRLLSDPLPTLLLAGLNCSNLIRKFLKKLI